MRGAQSLVERRFPYRLNVGTGGKVVSIFGGAHLDSRTSGADLINTPLQRGVVRARDGRKPFQRFPGLRGRNGPFDDLLNRRSGGAPCSWWSDASTVGKRIETVETVSMSSAPNVTPLKRGVNERFAEPGAIAGQTRRPKAGGNPKAEGRRPKESRSPNRARPRVSDFGTRASFGLRASAFGLQSPRLSFGLRTSKLSAQ